MNLIQNCIALQGHTKWTKPEARLLLPYRMLFFTATLLAAASLLEASSLTAPIRIAVAIAAAAFASLLPAVGVLELMLITIVLFAGSSPVMTAAVCLCLLFFLGSSQPTVTVLAMTLSMASGGIFGGNAVILLVFGLYLAYRCETPSAAKLGILVPVYGIYTAACLALYDPALAQSPAAFAFYAAIGLASMLLFGFVKFKKQFKVRILRNLPTDFVVFLILAGVLIGCSFAAKALCRWETEESALSILLGSLGALALSRLFDDEGLMLLFKKKSHARELLSKETELRTPEEKVLGTLTAGKKTYRKQLFSVICSGIFVAASSFATLQLLRCGWPLLVQIVVSAYSFGLPFVWEFGDDLLRKSELSDPTDMASNFSSALDFLSKVRDVLCCIFVALKVIAIYSKAIKNAPAQGESDETRESKNQFENFFRRILNILDNAAGTPSLSGAASYAASEVGAGALSAGALNSLSSQVLPVALSAVLAVTSTGLAQMPEEALPAPPPVIAEQTDIVEPPQWDRSVFGGRSDIAAKNRPLYAYYDTLYEASYDLSTYDFEDFDNTFAFDGGPTYAPLIEPIIYEVPSDGYYGLIATVQDYGTYEEYSDMDSTTLPIIIFIEKQNDTAPSSWNEGPDKDGTWRTWQEYRAGDILEIGISGLLGDHNKPAASFKFVQYRVNDDDPVDTEQI